MTEETPMEMRARLEREARAERERLRARQRARAESLVVFGVVLALFLAVGLAFVSPRLGAVEACRDAVRARLGAPVTALFPPLWAEVRALRTENGLQVLASQVDTAGPQGAGDRRPYRCTFRYGAPESFAVEFP